VLELCANGSVEGRLTSSRRFTDPEGEAARTRKSNTDSSAAGSAPSSVASARGTGNSRPSTAGSAGNTSIRRRPKILGWRQRVRIAVGTARALSHLHQLTPPMLHRDVKSANVLLDEDDEPKVRGPLSLRGRDALAARGRTATACRHCAAPHEHCTLHARALRDCRRRRPTRDPLTLTLCAAPHHQVADFGTVRADLKGVGADHATTGVVCGTRGYMVVRLATRPPSCALQPGRRTSHFRCRRTFAPLLLPPRLLF